MGVGVTDAERLSRAESRRLLEHERTEMRSCDDGYPGCRHAEATGRWCAGECRTELQKELTALLEKREQVRAKQMERIHNGGMTRARTTTSNAAADRLNERIVWLREQLKTPNVKLRGPEAAFCAGPVE